MLPRPDRPPDRPLERPGRPESLDRPVDRPLDQLFSPEVARQGPRGAIPVDLGSILGRPNIEKPWFYVGETTISTKSTFPLSEATRSRSGPLWDPSGTPWATFWAPRAALGDPQGTPGTLLGRPGGAPSRSKVALGCSWGRWGAPGEAQTPPRSDFGSILGSIWDDSGVNYELTFATRRNTDWLAWRSPKSGGPNDFHMRCPSHIPKSSIYIYIYIYIYMYI